MLILSIIATILVYPLWMFIHEWSHLKMADRTVGVEWYKMFLYPHTYNGHFYWARVQYLIYREPTKWEMLLISLAPRIPGLVGLLLAPLAFWLGIYPLGILLAGGIIDTFVGSTGFTPASDLQKAAATGYVSKVELRVMGLVLASLSSILCAIAIFL